MPTVRTELKAADFMTREPVCVTPSTTIAQLARLFEDNGISGAPVVDQQGSVIGIVSKTDLIRECSRGTANIPPAYLFEVLREQQDEEEAVEIEPEPDAVVEDFMTEDPVTVSPDAEAAAVAREMVERRIHRVIVVDEENFPVGIITSLDLLGVVSRSR